MHGDQGKRTSDTPNGETPHVMCTSAGPWRPTSTPRPPFPLETFVFPALDVIISSSRWNRQCFTAFEMGVLMLRVCGARSMNCVFLCFNRANESYSTVPGQSKSTVPFVCCCSSVVNLLAATIYLSEHHLHIPCTFKSVSYLCVFPRVGNPCWQRFCCRFSTWG